MTRLNPSYLSLDLVAIFQSLFGNSLLEFLDSTLHLCREPTPDRFLLLLSSRRAAKHIGFLSSGYARQFHINLWAYLFPTAFQQFSLKFLELLTRSAHQILSASFP